MKNIYYVKANREEWEYPHNSGNPTDWDNFPTNVASQDFATFTRNQLYWKNLKKGDIIIGHSSYLSHRISKDKTKFKPYPRISAIAIVEKEEHFSEQLECDAVTLKKIIEFDPIPINRDVVNDLGLSNADPFDKGTNRCTITKLDKKETDKITKLILKKNPNLKPEFKRLRLIRN